MKKIVLMAIVMATGMSATAQEKVKTTISADIVNQYIWRGQDLGNISIQRTERWHYRLLVRQGRS